MTIKLSVVVASLDADHSLEACLKAFQEQLNAPELEIIVVVAGSNGATLVRRKFPEIKLVELASGSLIPALWEVGMEIATGDLVAITTAHCLPAKTWAKAAIETHDSGDYAAVGGAIEPLAGLSWRDWAVYFLRYSQYMWPFQPNKAHDVPGDNVIYKSSALAPYLASGGEGFWENEVHPGMRRAGLELFSTPNIIMYHQASPSARAFFRQRFRHGQRFGSNRVAQAGLKTRLKYVLTSPLIPLIFSYRIGRRVLAKGRNLGAFIVSLPYLLYFLTGWWLGEVKGYLVGPEKVANQALTKSSAPAPVVNQFNG